MAAAEDEVRGRRQSSSASHFTAFFPVRTTTPFPPRLRPRKVAPLARRSRATSKSCVAIAIDDANGSFFGARAVARVRVAAAERRPWRGTSFSPHSRAARPSRRARTRLLTTPGRPPLFSGRNRTPRPLARTRRVRANAPARLAESGVPAGCAAAPVPRPRLQRQRDANAAETRRRVGAPCGPIRRTSMLWRSAA